MKWQRGPLDRSQIPDGFSSWWFMPPGDQMERVIELFAYWEEEPMLDRQRNIVMQVRPGEYLDLDTSSDVFWAGPIEYPENG